MVINVKILSVHMQLHPSQLINLVCF